MERLLKRIIIEETRKVIEGTAGEDMENVLSGIAFNRDFESIGELMTLYDNSRIPPSKKNAIRKLEKKLKENDGDKSWLLLHKG